MDGWMGQILRVDLTHGDYSIEDLDLDLAEDFIGGRGLASKILFDEVEPKIDPFSPENKVIFAAGPLTGTGVVGAARCGVVTKSPLTGGIISSNLGGHFGPELKFAGYDAIIIEGKSPEPVYLMINDDRVELKPAQRLWGESTTETQDMIRAEIEDSWKARETQVACIGPAGENLVKFASIIHSGRAFGRSGVGAVMGSKKLKAVAIRGTKGISLGDVDSFKEATESFLLNKIKGSFFTEVRPSTGTWYLVPMFKGVGMLPVRNYQAGSFEGIDKIDEKVMRDEILRGNKSCFACPCADTRLTEVTAPEFQGKGEGPEYESWGKLGPDCGIDNIAGITKANYLCNEMGMDTISMGGTIACAMELYEKGFLPEEDVGYQLNFGNAKALVELVEKTGLRQGFGDILAEGSYRLAEKYGHPEISMTVKSQELPAIHPQGSQLIALAFATSNRGACHTKASVSLDERFEVAGQATKVKQMQDYITVIDAAGLCWSVMMRPPLQIEMVSTFLRYATGVDYTDETTMLVGERIWNLERTFNLKAGHTEKDDYLPERLLEEPVLKDEAEGQVARLGEMLPEYYKLRGWDENGVPTSEKLAQLGLTQEGRL